MAFVVSIAKTLRNHWKKSIFFTLAGGYGIKYGHDRYEEHLLRRVYCAEAKKYGDEKISLSEKPRKVTVFLNPATHSGKSRKLFEKNAAPILHLAGIEVDVVRTEYEGQVKKFISVLEEGETDAVIVAGGDGTLLEAVTGILRKEDRKFHKTPVGVIPLGNHNTFSRLFYGVDKGHVRMMVDAAMAVVKNVTKKVDVLKVDGGEGKTTFALCGMEIGAYRDAEARKSKYWYFGPLKSRWTHIRTAMKDWPPVVKANVSYVEATEENMKQVEEEEEKERKASWSFWRFLLRKKQVVQEAEQRDSMMKTTAEGEDENRVSGEISTLEISLMSPNMISEQELAGIHLEIGPEEPTRTQVISQGWQRMKRKAPRYGSDDNKQLLVKDVSIALDIPETQSEPIWYNIDGESFEAIPVRVSLLQKKLNFFCPVFEPTVNAS
ncbi:acylglycerol kinase, mitochondrial-like [Littorina saxatilis]|uniref:Acylglycerol kinase, mitochondrial n=1 Tax=Littorina saxatilis TaxID=31220 RepID=A0AAN9B4E1_9CAEN